MSLIYTGAMHHRINKKDHLGDSWSIRVPIIPTIPGEQPGPDAQPQNWIIDTGCTFEAYAWLDHLKRAGIPFNDQVKLQTVSLITSTGETKPVWLCKAHLWLVTSDPQREPFRLTLLQGLCCNDETVDKHDDEIHRAVIGMRLLVRLLRLEVYFADRRFSIWSRDP